MQAILGFATVSAVLTVIPGMDTTLVLRSTLANGRRPAVATGLGVTAGLLIWGAAAALGAAAVLAASQLAYQAVTLAGAGYMVYVGVRMIVRSFRDSNLEIAATNGRSAVPWRAFAVGAWTNVLNPKIGVFYIATIPQFIPAGASPLGTGLILAGVHAFITLLWFAVIISGANVARRWLADARAVRIVDRVAGTVMLGFGAKLALQQSY